MNANLNKIHRWGYDSYSYDEIWDYIEENDPEQIENDIWGYFSDAQSWNDIDFVLGIAIYRIRTGVVLKDKTLRKLREIIDDILERSPFEEWKDKNKRIIKLQHERRIINALLKKMDFKFGEIIPRKFIIDLDILSNIFCPDIGRSFILDFISEIIFRSSFVKNASPNTS